MFSATIQQTVYICNDSVGWNVFQQCFPLTSQSHSVSLTLWTPSHESSCEHSGFPLFQTPSHTLCILYLASRQCFRPQHPAGSLFDFRHPRPCPVHCIGRDLRPSADGRWRGVVRASGVRCSTGRTADTGRMSRQTCAGECAHGKLRCPQLWRHRQRTYELWGCSPWASSAAVIQRFWSSGLEVLHPLLAFFLGWESIERNKW